MTNSKEYNRQWRKNNPERVREHNRRERQQYKERYPERAKEKSREGSKLYRQRHPMKMREQNLNRYGITVEIFDQILVNQGRACTICFRPFTSSKDTHLDHDHSTGALRGILCSSCNHGLGNFKDNEAALLRAVDYLCWYRRQP